MKCFTFSQMDRWVYWNVFPGLRCRLCVTARASLAGSSGTRIPSVWSDDSPCRVNGLWKRPTCSYPAGFTGTRCRHVAPQWI